jgi:selenocysteine lyase/cysteine desulfurase
MVDAAHAFAHLDYRVTDLDCDYLGTSLHKWLCAPLGAGMLYVKRDKIAKVWPLMGDTRHAATDIRKLEHLGTRDEAVHAGLREAIRFHNSIGAANKLARLRYLHRAWAEAVRDRPGFTVNTPRDPARHGGVGSVAVAGIEPVALADYWMKEHGIFTVGTPAVPGVRVTPGIPTPLAHVQRFVEALEAAHKRFAPA